MASSLFFGEAMPRFSFLLRLPILLGLAHLYVAARLIPAATTPSLRWGIAGGIFLVYLLIMGGFQMRRAVGRPGGDMTAWAGFLALGFFAWLFVLTIVRDLLLAITFGLRSAGATLALPPQASAITVVGVAFAAVLLGLYNSRRVARVARVDVALPNLPPDLHGFTIAQLSDVHVGPTIKRSYLQRIVDRTNSLNADTIVLTGDLIDGSVEDLKEHVAPFAQLKAPHGVFGITGNHEYYSGAAAWVQAFTQLGLTMLMNQHQVLSHGSAKLIMAGVTDYGAAAFDNSQASDPVAALRGAPADAAVRILLAHQPRSAPAAAAAGFDLQLSGHTHGGQIWPWNYFVPLQQPFVTGLHRQGKMMVYVSRGTGYWGPPMRIGAPSEITLIRLVRPER